MAHQLKDFLSRDTRQKHFCLYQNPLGLNTNGYLIQIDFFFFILPIEPNSLDETHRFSPKFGKVISIAIKS